MMSSAYYAQKKREFESIKGTISGLIGSLGALSSLVSNVQNSASSVIIGGVSLDGGKLGELLTFLSNIHTNLNAIISECNVKIPEYQQLYQQAYARELEARKKRTEKKEL